MTFRRIIIPKGTISPHQTTIIQFPSNLETDAIVVQRTQQRNAPAHYTDQDFYKSNLNHPLRNVNSPSRDNSSERYMNNFEEDSYCGDFSTNNDYYVFPPQISDTDLHEDTQNFLNELQKPQNNDSYNMGDISSYQSVCKHVQFAPDQKYPTRESVINRKYKIRRKLCHNIAAQAELSLDFSQMFPEPVRSSFLSSYIFEDELKRFKDEARKESRVTQTDISFKGDNVDMEKVEQLLRDLAMNSKQID